MAAGNVQVRLVLVSLTMSTFHMPSPPHDSTTTPYTMLPPFATTFHNYPNPNPNRDPTKSYCGPRTSYHHSHSRARRIFASRSYVHAPLTRARTHKQTHILACSSSFCFLDSRLPWSLTHLNNASEAPGEWRSIKFPLLTTETPKLFQHIVPWPMLPGGVLEIPHRQACPTRHPLPN